MEKGKRRETFESKSLLEETRKEERMRRKQRRTLFLFDEMIISDADWFLHLEESSSARTRKVNRRCLQPKRRREVNRKVKRMPIEMKVNLCLKSRSLSLCLESCWELSV